MKLNRSLVAKVDGSEVRIHIQLTEKAYYDSRGIRCRVDKLTDEVHACLAQHFHVKDIKVK